MLVFLENRKSPRANRNSPVRFDANISFGKKSKNIPHGTYSWDLAEIVRGNLFVIPRIPEFQYHSP